MRESISYIANAGSGTPAPELVAPWRSSKRADIRRFHASFPGYRPTPLVHLNAPAESWGLGNLWLKDESQRLGLSAFKVLGASYAVAELMKRRLNLQSVATLDHIRRALTKHGDRPTLVTATDGNHGRAVAWTARQLGCPAVVYMPRGSVEARVEAIRGEGAEVQVLDCLYEGCVDQAEHDAKVHGWWLVQDTARLGYESVPRWIMQGYLTLLDEVFEQLEDARPTHVFLQCGVGSFAGAIAAGLVASMPEKPPWIGLVQPAEADSAARAFASGRPSPVPGNLNTIMAGMACAELSPLAWPVLQACCAGAFTCPDEVTREGMRLAAEHGVVSGETGAVTLGLLRRLCNERALARWREKTGLGRKARVLLFSTEGATDPAGYREVVPRENGQGKRLNGI